MQQTQNQASPPSQIKIQKKIITLFRPDTNLKHNIQLNTVLSISYHPPNQNIIGIPTKEHLQHINILNNITHT